MFKKITLFFLEKKLSGRFLKYFYHSMGTLWAPIGILYCQVPATIQKVSVSLVLSDPVIKDLVIGRATYAHRPQGDQRGDFLENLLIFVGGSG